MHINFPTVFAFQVIYTTLNMAPILSALKSFGEHLLVYCVKNSHALRLPLWLSDDTSRNIHVLSRHLLRSKVWRKLILKLIPMPIILLNYFYQNRRLVFLGGINHQFRGSAAYHPLSVGKKSWINYRRSRSENLLFSEAALGSQTGWILVVSRDVAGVGSPWWTIECL